jgi:hypothetical protein
MKIKTHNGFWGSVREAAVVAAVFSTLIAGKVADFRHTYDISPALVAILALVLLAIFLWPAARNFYDVWLSLRRVSSQNPEAFRRGISLPPSSLCPSAFDPARAAPSRRLGFSESARS